MRLKNIHILLRTKSIRGNRSNFGWKTAIEYEQDDLASDSDDEKRMQRSERAEKRKSKVQVGNLAQIFLELAHALRSITFFTSCNVFTVR